MRPRPSIIVKLQLINCFDVTSFSLNKIGLINIMIVFCEIDLKRPETSTQRTLTETLDNIEFLWKQSRSKHYLIAVVAIKHLILFSSANKAIKGRLNSIKHPERKTSIIKKSFYLAEFYTSRLLHFQCLGTNSYGSWGSVDYYGIKNRWLQCEIGGKMHLFSGVHF